MHMISTAAVPYIATPILLAIATNLLIYRSQMNRENASPYLPPGYIIGLIWTAIFGLLGYVLYLLDTMNRKMGVAYGSIIALIAFCLAYPFLTGLKVRSGLLLNLVSLIFAFVVAILVAKESFDLVYYFVPLLAWASYVNGVFLHECSRRVDW
jgi:tryptophan-rich sensory protein